MIWRVPPPLRNWYILIGWTTNLQIPLNVRGWDNVCQGNETVKTCWDLISAVVSLGMYCSMMRYLAEQSVLFAKMKKSKVLTIPAIPYRKTYLKPFLYEIRRVDEATKLVVVVSIWAKTPFQTLFQSQSVYKIPCSIDFTAGGSQTIKYNKLGLVKKLHIQS